MKNLTLASAIALSLAAAAASMAYDLSENGRIVAVESFADLAPHDPQIARAVYVYDRHTGALEAVGVPNDPGPDLPDSLPGSANFMPSLSGNGRYLAFVSEPTIFPGGSIYWHDRLTGEMREIPHSGVWTYDPAISLHGRYVAFTSVGVGQQVLLFDSASGTVREASVDSNGKMADWFIQNGEEVSPASGNPAISADGRYVAFYSNSPDLVLADTNQAYDIFVHDHVTGATTRVSVDSAGNQGNGHSRFNLAISANGRYVAFESEATNLVAGDTNAVEDIFVHDRQQQTTRRVSVSSGGAQANGASAEPKFSANGQFVAFHSLASNLILADSNGVEDVFLHDLAQGTTRRVSVSSAEEQGNGSSSRPVLSRNARFILFQSAATNLSDTGSAGLLLRDRATGTTDHAIP